MLKSPLKNAAAILAMILTIALAAACGSNGDLTTTEAEQLQAERGAQATIEALDSQLAELQVRNDDREAQEARSILQTQQAPTPTPILPPTPRPTQTPVPTPTPGVPGICDRSPAMQTLLLEELDNTLCQHISEHELYRITNLPEISLPSANPGDFRGLVNLTELRLTLRSQHLDRTLLEGLENVHLAVIQAPGFTTDSLDALPHLRTLDLILLQDNTYREDPTGQALPDLNLTQLTRLRIGNMAELHSRTLRPSVLTGLPNLRELTLIVSPTAYETQKVASFTLRPDLLASNPDLVSLEIRQGSNQLMKTTLFEDSFTGNQNLAKITLYTHETDAHPNSVLDLTKLENLSIIGQPEGQKPTFRLSPKAPLYSRIYHAYEQPVGFQVAEPGT